MIGWISWMEAANHAAQRAMHEVEVSRRILWKLSKEILFRERNSWWSFRKDGVSGT